jgi:DNA-binding winged helix-turn-helix (wHTH) protein
MQVCSIELDVPRVLMDTRCEPFLLNNRLVDPNLDCIMRDGITIKIERQHMQVLLLLVKQGGGLVSIRKIEDEVWGGRVVTPNAIHRAIAQLRQALGDDSKVPKYIQTAARRGYRLIASVAPLPDSTRSAEQPRAVESDTVITAQQVAAPAVRTRIIPPLNWKMGLLFSAALAVPIVGAAIWSHQEAKQAKKEKLRANQLSDFMVNVFTSGESHAAGRQMTAAELTANGAQRISVELREFPEIRVRMLEAIAVSYSGTEKTSLAIAPLQEAVQIRRDIGTGRELARTLLAFGAALRDVGRYDDSEVALQEAVDLFRSQLGEQSIEYAEAVGLLGNLDFYRGRYAKALERLTYSLQRVQALQGENHTSAAQILEVIAAIRRFNSDFSGAEQALRQALRILEISQPPLFPSRLTVEYALGNVLLNQNRLDDAGQVLEHLLGAQRQVTGDASPDVALTLGTLGDVRFRQGRIALGEKLTSEAIAIFAAMGESGDENRANVLQSLAVQFLKRGQFSRSERILRDSIELLEVTHNQRYLANAEHFLAESLLAQNRVAEAEAYVVSALERLRKSEVPRWRVERSNNTLGEVLLRTHRAEAGRKMIIDSYRWLMSDPVAPTAAKEGAKRRMRLLHS